MDKNCNFLTANYFAHRGLYNKVIKENSLEAFKRAITFNYGIELDVRLTKDNKLIICHDYLVETKIVEESNFFVLKEIDNSLTTLQQVLKIVGGRVPLLIELKDTKDNILLCELTKEALTNYKGDYAICSFDTKMLKWWKKNSPQTTIGIISSVITNGILKVFKNSLKQNVKKIKPEFISFRIKDLPNYYIGKLRKKKIIILGWTAKDMKELTYALEYCDNVIFDSFLPKKE